MWFQKISIPTPQGGDVGNSTGEEFLKRKHFKAKYEAKLELVEHRRSLNETLLHRKSRSMDIL